MMKKHNAINYHAVREAAAAGILRVGKEDGKTNLADLLTKVLNGKKRWNICWTSCGDRTTRITPRSTSCDSHPRSLPPELIILMALLLGLCLPLYKRMLFTSWAFSNTQLAGTK